MEAYGLTLKEIMAVVEKAEGLERRGSSVLVKSDRKGVSRDGR